MATITSRGLRVKKAASTGSSVEIEYNIFGSEDESVIYALLLATAPTTWTVDGKVLPLSDLEIRLIRDSVDCWDGTANYVDPDSDKNQERPDVGDVEFSFDTTGGTEHITAALSQTELVGGNDFYKTLIGVKRNKGSVDVEGTDIASPQLKFTLTKTYDATAYDWPTAARELAAQTATVNDDTFYGFEAGEVLFLGVRIQGKTRDKVTIAFEFECSQNIVDADGIAIGDTGVNVVKQGHQYLWIEYSPKEIPLPGGEKVIGANPDYAFVSTVYRTSDFSALGVGT